MVPRNKIERTFIRRYVPDDEKVNNGSRAGFAPLPQGIEKVGYFDRWNIVMNAQTRRWCCFSGASMLRRWAESQPLQETPHGISDRVSWRRDRRCAAPWRQPRLRPRAGHRVSLCDASRERHRLVRNG